MKASERKREKKFEPFTLDIAIESEEELLELVKRLNLTYAIVNDGCKNYPRISCNSLSVLWKLLDDKWTRLKGGKRK